MSAKPKVKICGVTKLADAELAVSLGAWTVGLIFYEGSPRRCSLSEASKISASLRRKAELAGVFVNASLEQIAQLVEEVQLSIVQLHGDEGPSFCSEVARRTGAKVCKAVQVADAGDIRDLERFHVDYHLLDAKAPSQRTLRGGTGETFDWSLVAQRRSKVPLLLSGGLTPENVASAIAAAHPFAVDTASGVEAAPGVKDPDLMRAFFAAAVVSSPSSAGGALGGPSPPAAGGASSPPAAGGALGVSSPPTAGGALGGPSPLAAAGSPSPPATVGIAAPGAGGTIAPGAGGTTASQDASTRRADAAHNQSQGGSEPLRIGLPKTLYGMHNFRDDASPHLAAEPPTLCTSHKFLKRLFSHALPHAAKPLTRPTTATHRS